VSMEKTLGSSAPSASDTAQVVAFAPLLALGTIVVGIGAHVFRPFPVLTGLPLPTIGKWLVIAAGCLVIAARAQMLKAGTTMNPNGTTTALVTGGPYRFTRNPMYLALCLVSLGIGFLLRDLTPIILTLVLAVLLHFGVIRREERFLERRFGEAYSAYRERVHRWL
jgi:protein-S-isoprenylcysteine O-methyltransferase Ste14